MEVLEFDATVDGARVVVDVTSLQGLATHPGVWLVVLLAVVVAAATAAQLPAHRRPLLLASLLTGSIGAAIALATAPLVLGRIANWVPGVAQTIAQSSPVVGLGGGAVAILLTCAGLLVAFTSRRVQDLVVAGIALVAGLGGLVGVWHVQGLRREVVMDLQAAFPLPRLVFVGQDLAAKGIDPSTVPPEDRLPEVQVGQTRTLKPVTFAQLGVGSTSKTPSISASSAKGLAPLGDRLAFPASDIDSWRLYDARAVLAATEPGPHVAVAVARRGAVRVELPVQFVAVEDRGPAAFPLVEGHSQRFRVVRGPIGVVARAASGAKATAAESEGRVVSATVQSTRIKEGFRVARLHMVTEEGLRTVDAIARNGAIVEYPSRKALVLEADDGATCQALFAGYADCRCSPVRSSAGAPNVGGIDQCVRHQEDTAGAFMRLGLAVMTLGFSEVADMCKGCGDGHEEGLIRIRDIAEPTP